MITMKGTVAHVSVADVVKQISLKIKVKGLKAWRFRLWLGLKLLSLAAFVIGTGVQVEVETKDFR